MRSVFIHQAAFRVKRRVTEYVFCEDWIERTGIVSPEAIHFSVFKEDKSVKLHLQRILI